MHVPVTPARNPALPPQSRPIVERIGGFLFGWLHRQRLLAELNALTDRELADIGLTRGEFSRALGGPEPRPAAAPHRLMAGRSPVHA